ncbi:MULTISPECIES: DDE-type integrase/transposase/recombinase [Parvimonas]|uniref:DDE-type integrase/transposase/recombinase n=1 Tax=Parvimonas parva TaxID=2769485 RepID=A0ABS1CA82_9FIRM|nr:MULTISPECIES: DDE-type integrase/transposase/recombinase [Parvimonas]MBK1469012.1 DDE-type integrase/transposase/recombinase [Parvimonas parva]
MSLDLKIRYLPHTLNTRYYACKTYRNCGDVSYVCRKYKISVSSLMRWNKRFDGSIESLKDKSHKPLSKHPNSHTEKEIKHIKDYLRRNPNMSIIELYVKLKTKKGYKRHINSLYRVVKKLGLRVSTYNTKKEKEKYIPKKYDTPSMLGIKWQLDVKYVPKTCYVGEIPEKFYQYTMIDEATRERFIYAFKEKSSFSTIQFVKMAIRYFGYKPKIIQTDNGSEFTHFRKTDKIHPLDRLCFYYNIEHQLIRPRTPRHNGKVERSHRNDNQRFYKDLKFYSYEDLIYQMKKYLYRSNRIPMKPLGFLTPIEKRKQLILQIAT